MFQITSGVFVIVLFTALLVPTFIPNIELAALMAESTREALADVAVKRL